MSPSQTSPHERIVLPTPPVPSPTVTELLKDNHKKYHVYFNDQGFHNHTAHTVIALHTLGATPETIRATYEATRDYQLPAKSSPEAVSEENWKTHLGDELFYQAYLDFFHAELEKHENASSVLEKYVFSTDANLVDGSLENGPQMVSRIIDSLLHPAIHIGYGLEFTRSTTTLTTGGASSDGLEELEKAVKELDTGSYDEVAKLMLVEGLAQTAIHQSHSTSFVPARCFLGSHHAATSSLEEPVHALTILARVLADPALADAAQNLYEEDAYLKAVLSLSDKVNALVDAWLGNKSLEVDDEAAKTFLESKTEELIWASTLIYGVTGYGLGKDKSKFGFVANFVYLHYVTATYFLPAFVNHLKPHSSLLLLRAYFAVILCLYIGTGRPDISKDAIKALFADESLLRFGGADTEEKTWDRITQASVAHLDEHVPKLQRSLKVFDGQLRHGKPEDFQRKGRVVELEGAEYIDGSLFLRVAVLSARRIGTMEDVAEHLTGRPGGAFVWD